AGAAGVLVDGSVRAQPPGRLTGLPARDAALRLVRTLRQGLGAGLPIVASGGVHEPVDALNLFQAGAELVSVDSGLVYSGPGLPKRINAATLCAMHRTPAATPSDGPAARSWFWLALLGAGMLGG